MDFSTQLTHYKDLVESAFGRLLPQRSSYPERLHESMHYALDAGGKRLRPILLLAAADIRGQAGAALPAAVAVECLHTYTLIHDDLPAMDDSPLRRGKPSTHIAYGEATAILAGDALLTEAFLLLAEGYKGNPQLGLALTRDLALAAGSRQLIGGQFVDTVSAAQSISAQTMEYIHLNKTAALLQASLVMGARHAECSEEELESLRKLGAAMGLAFQIKDDILDVSSSEQQLGKSVNADAQNQKNTYVAMYGVQAAEVTVQKLTKEAIDLCSGLSGDVRFLVELIGNLAGRRH